MTDKAGARRPIELDLERFERLAKNLAALLSAGLLRTKPDRTGPDG